MPLFACPDCNHQCSTEALACPSCGRPFQSASMESRLPPSFQVDIREYSQAPTIYVCSNCHYQSHQPVESCPDCLGPKTMEIRAATGGPCLKCGKLWSSDTTACPDCGILLNQSSVARGDSYRCPNCRTTHPPAVLSRISSGGWLFFIVFLLLCFPISLLGFAMKEQYRVCSVCKAYLN